MDVVVVLNDSFTCAIAGTYVISENQNMISMHKLFFLTYIELVNGPINP
jgi:hypothetical protein